MENEATPRLIVPDPEMPDVETVRKWLTICGSDHSGKPCNECPYYPNKCDDLLLDAGRIIKFLMG